MAAVADDDEHRRELEVVLWRGDGRASATVEGLATVPLHLDDQRGIARAVAEIRDRAGLEVAVLVVSDTHLHAELLGAPAVEPAWRTPDEPLRVGAVWNAPGWFASTGVLVTEALTSSAVGATRVGPVRQVKHWSISAILEIETDAGTFWFKQVPAFMAHEAALVEWLADVRPGLVPEVVAKGEDWFLAPAFPAPPEERTVANPYAELADLQLAVADRSDELLGLGCPDRTAPSVLRDLAALPDRHDLIEPSLAARLAEGLPRITELVERLAASPVPSASIVHGDLHSGNWTRRSDGSWLVFDWTDGCVSHPFLDLGVLPRKDAERRAAWLDAYLGPWRTAFGDAAVDETLAAALPLGAAFQALSYQRIADGVGGGDGPSWHPSIASYLAALLDGA